MQVGTYPTRNFATLGPFIVLQPTCVSGALISDALYLSPGRSDYLIPLMVLRVRHIVSEDSETG